MGSWNATCGVTQLPITAGDRVVLVPLIVKQPDFLARDNLGGGGSSDNDCIAQPFSVPIAGEYDDYGGLAADEGHPAMKYLIQALQTWIDADHALVRIKSGKPCPVKALDEDAHEVLAELMRGEFQVLVPNARKQWLQQLRDTYEKMTDKEKPGFSHYLPQMEVDPATLPDRLGFPLAGMFVPEALYTGLVDVQAKDAVVGYWDEKSNTLVKRGATRREELELQTMLTSGQRAAIADMRTELGSAVAAGELTQQEVDDVLKILPIHALPQPSRLNHHCFFGSGVADALVADAALNDDAPLRKLWVDFMLFSAAFYAMRKLWAPQAGAGSQCGLYETAQLYQTVHAFVAQTLESNTNEEACS